MGKWQANKNDKTKGKPKTKGMARFTRGLELMYKFRRAPKYIISQSCLYTWSEWVRM